MSKRVFRQHFIMRWFAHTFNILGFVMPLYLIAGFIYKAAQTTLISAPTIWASLFIQAFFLSACISTSLILTANFFCEIATDDTGLYVSFLWRKLFIRWQDVIEIKPMAFGFWGFSRILVVTTNALTPFHRLYGLIYGFSPRPSFIITPITDSQGDLIKLIENHTRR